MTSYDRTARTRRPLLRGAFTALVTPFTPDGAVDETAFRRLVSWQGPITRCRSPPWSA